MSLGDSTSGIVEDASILTKWLKHDVLSTVNIDESRIGIKVFGHFGSGTAAVTVQNILPLDSYDTSSIESAIDSIHWTSSDRPSVDDLIDSALIEFDDNDNDVYQQYCCYDTS